MSRDAGRQFIDESSSSGPPVAVPPQLADLFKQIAASGPRDGRRRRGPAWLLHFAREVPRRRRFMKQFGWAVPTPEVIAAIRDFVGERRLLEVGAGSGLWSHLLSVYGVDTLATDDYSWTVPDDSSAKAALPSGFAVEAGHFYPVERLDAVAAVQKYADHTALLIGWPPPDKQWPYLALKAFQGDRLIYTGDWNATADEWFRLELGQNWRRDDLIDLPTWPSLHDSVYLYERQQWLRTPGLRRANPHLSSQ